MLRPRTALPALLPFLLHGMAREVDRGLGLVLRAEVGAESPILEVARATAAEGPASTLRVLGWALGGLALTAALAWRRTRREPGRLDDSLAREGRTFAPLYLRPALTLLALAAVALRPAYPYGFTMPVALTQDWGIAQDAAALAAMAALRLPAPRLPAPGPASLWLMALLACAHLTPAQAWWWDAHPGNEPKYLRMAVALGHGLSFDAEAVSAAMEELEPRPLARAVATALGGIGREGGRMLAALLDGPHAVGSEAIRATRITRQTIRGKQGGVYYVLAPGPSILLAPTLRLDRALNRARGTPGRLAVSVLCWNALAAVLVLAVFLLLRDATGRPGLAATLALAFAVLPPLLFYGHQFYPELLGALAFAVIFRVLALRREWLLRHPWLVGWLVASLPWLHQKFLPVWLVLAVTAVVLAVFPSAGSGSGRGGSTAAAIGLLVPQAVSLFLFALYNFAITGSVRPDALFLAWGPGGVTSARMGQGLLGLLIDARYGILPYVPLLALAAAGLALGGARRFAAVLPAAAVYYLTVASADNWAGAVSNLGRYVMPLIPLAIALAGIAVARVSTRRGAIALVLVLAAWSGLFALSLYRDPHAANDSALLLAKSAWADAHQYIPGLFLRRWSDGAPGLAARVVAWLVAIALVVAWLCRVDRARDASGASPKATLVGVLAAVLALGLVLERWPGGRAGPAFGDAVALGDGLLFVEGEARVASGELVLGPGSTRLLVRAPAPLTQLRATVGGHGLLRASGVAPIVLRAQGASVKLALRHYHTVHGTRGAAALFSCAELRVEGEAILRPDAIESREPGEDRAR